MLSAEDPSESGWAFRVLNSHISQAFLVLQVEQLMKAKAAIKATKAKALPKAAEAAAAAVLLALGSGVLGLG